MRVQPAGVCLLMPASNGQHVLYITNCMARLSLGPVSASGSVRIKSADVLWYHCIAQSKSYGNTCIALRQPSKCSRQYNSGLTTQHTVKN